MKNLRNSNGITLVALVVTIVVLLILTSISINILTGDNGFITKAKEIRSNIEKAEAEGQAKINSLQQAEYTEDGAVILNDENAPTINSMEVTDITDKSFTVKVNVTETGSGLAKIEYSIDDGEHYITPNYNQARSYTFEDLNVGFEEYKVKVKVTDINNNSSYANKTIEKFKIGDYVNYTYAPVASGYSLPSTRSGYDSDQTIAQSSETLQWRILNIDETTRTIDLVSATPTDNTVTFKGALGYNNGVYLLNDMCASLYSNSSLGITARSINLVDMEKHLTTDGLAARNAYNKYGTTKTYTDAIYLNYPNLYAIQKGAGINLAEGQTVIQPSDMTVPDPYNESSAYYSTPTTETCTNASNSLTVTNTHYCIPINSTNYGEGASILSGSDYFWIASRYGDAGTPNAIFGLRVGSDYIGGTMMFYSKNAYDAGYCCLRPIVTLNSRLLDGTKDADGVWQLK